MINLNIIAIGRLKEKYLTEGVEEYSKRISKYAKLDIIELPDEKNPSNDSQAEITKMIDIEGDLILTKISKDAYVITLEIEGAMLSSDGLANLIDKTTQYQSNRIFFIIGGSHGLSPSVRKRADMALSFSKMTFPHQLMRLILVEQIYRSLSILNHTSYHK